MSIHVIPFVMVKASIVYRMPDRPAILQELVYELLDILPDYPVLNRYLQWWKENIEGQLHNVQYVSQRVADVRELRYASVVDFRLH